MSDALDGLPPLDVHAHIAPDVTTSQIEALGNSHTFAVTRSLEEARQVIHKSSRHITWGVGTHPADTAAQVSFNEKTFITLLPRFGLIGEIGLDRRAGDLSRQTATLTSILRIAADHPVLLSLHSAGAAGPLLDVLEQHPHPGAILHWWTDDGPDLDRAIATGAYFSVNVAMKPTILKRLPTNRVLSETDFPAHKVGAHKPGDTHQIEQQLTALWKTDPKITRHRIWVNLRQLATKAEALDRLPEPIADMLLTV